MWLSVDPLAEKFPSHSPYSFCFNNPLRFVDPDGRAPSDWINLGSRYFFDPKVKSQTEAVASYGFGAVHMPEGSTLNGRGNNNYQYTFHNDATVTDSLGLMINPTENFQTSGGSTIESSMVFNMPSSERYALFFNGLGNTLFGGVGLLGAASYCEGTLGAGAALGGGTAITLSIGEMSMGISQMADSFSDKPYSLLHQYSTIPGLIAGQNGSPIAPYVEGVSGFIPGTLSGSNTRGMLDALNPSNYSTLKKGTLTTLGAFDAYNDTKGLMQGTLDSTNK
jgi:hypothetical protein